MSVVIPPEPLRPPLFFFFLFYLCEQSISTPHPRTSSGRNHRSTPGSRKQAEQRQRNGDVLSGSVSSFEEALPSCQLFFSGFFFVCCFFLLHVPLFPHQQLQQTELIAAAERPGRDVASQPHVHIVQFLFNETRRWALLQSRIHLLIPPAPTSSTPHSHTHLHLPFLSSALIWSAAICSFICSSPGWPGYFYWISYYWSEGHGRLSFLVEIKTCSRCRTAWWKSTGIKYDTTIIRFR